MKSVKRAIAIATLVPLSLASFGCEEDSTIEDSMEEAGEEVEEAADDAEDSIDDAVD